MSPYETKFREPAEGLIRQEMVTYETINGQLVKTTVVRKFSTGDYVDSKTSTPLT